MLHVYLPDNMSARREAQAIDEMRRKISKSQALGKARREIDLEARATRLNRQLFGGLLTFDGIEFTRPMASRYGWCDTERRIIAISSELAEVPRWVLDYVIVHELAHLAIDDHGDEFWQLVGRYPRTERARGFLEGRAHLAAAGSVDSGCEVDSPPVAESGQVTKRPRVRGQKAHPGQLSLV